MTTAGVRKIQLVWLAVAGLGVTVFLVKIVIVLVEFGNGRL
jgi:hypothetical protein